MEGDAMPRRFLVVMLSVVASMALAAPPVLWDQLDWRLDRSVLVSRYLFNDQQPANPWPLYVRTLGPDEAPVADLLAEFRALSPDARARARTAARDLLASGRLAILDHAYRLRDAVQAREANVAGNGADPTPGFAEATGKAIERLADAVRRDPTLAEAWYHLAYFTDLAGDGTRAARAREAFFTVWPEQDEATQQALQPVRELAILDHAWYLRDSGRYQECLAWLDRHDGSLSRQAIDPGVSRATEARLIAGLCHAEQAEVGPALSIVSSLPLMELPHRATAPMRTYVALSNQQSFYVQRFGSDLDPHHNPAPDWTERPLDNLARERRESSYLRRWVKAWLSLRRGYEAETVRRDLGRVELELEFQPRLAWRWWQDQGLIREALGELELARICWARAAVYRPYFIYQPTGQGHGVARVHGLSGTGLPYFLGYGTFMISGSVWSYAANAALASEVEPGPLEGLMLRRLAGEALDVCMRRGFQPDQARALRGRLAFLAGDYDTAWDDLLAAWEALEPRQAAPADLALMLGLCRFNSGDWAAAAPWLTAFTRRSPDSPMGWLTLGLNHAMQGQDDDAFAAIDRAVYLQPDDATSLYNRGLLNYRLGRRDEAGADFRHAAERWPENAQIARMVEVVAEEAHYDLEMSAAPMRMNLPEAQRQSLANLLAAGRNNPGATELADLVAASPEDRAPLLEALEGRYQAEPTSANRVRLARARLLTDDHAGVQRVLGPAWPRGLDEVERRLLLYADRAAGEPSRAIDVATSAYWDTQDLPAEFLLLAATILLEHDHRDLAAEVVARGLRSEPGNRALGDLRRLLGQSP
jgi:tetratricopeptide (TPR) repeat protein